MNERGCPKVRLKSDFLAAFLLGDEFTTTLFKIYECDTLGCPFKSECTKTIPSTFQFMKK